MLGTVLGWLGSAGIASASGRTASIVVAASNSSEEAKAGADLVCDGIDDQVELRESLTRAGRFTVMIDWSPSTQVEVECYGRHSVEWLPGDYHLGETLVIPDAADVVIRAEGTYFHYEQATGDAVRIQGMNRCRYNFGTIDSHSSDAALRVKPEKGMASLMSFVNYMGLVGHDLRGTGLFIDPTVQNVCVNRFEGTDIFGFDTGIRVADAAKSDGSGFGKSDTNWFWISYIRVCKTCIIEGHQGIDSNVWNVNIDASIEDSVAMRAGGNFGKWYVIMGTFRYEGVNKAVILEPGAEHNVIEVHPPLEGLFQWEDNSGNDTNVILTSKSPPYRPAP